MTFPYSHRKTTQMLNAFARWSDGVQDKLKALKLVYFADRYHLRRYGRPITGDEYLAMPFGPVASGAKDLAEMSEFLSDEERDYGSRYLVPAGPHAYKSLHEVDQKVLSKSDMIALEWAQKNFGFRDNFELVDLTHFYPEWKRHEALLTAKRATRVPMDYLDFLQDPPREAQVDECYSLSAEERAALLDGIEDRRKFERMLS